MEDKEIIEMTNEAYQQGFRDGFEYGTGKRSPYAQGGIVSPYASGARDVKPSVTSDTEVVVSIPASNTVDVKDIVNQINKQIRQSPRSLHGS